jgi:hypothetical protein
VMFWACFQETGRPMYGLFGVVEQKQRPGSGTP